MFFKLVSLCAQVPLICVRCDLVVDECVLRDLVVDECVRRDLVVDECCYVVAAQQTNTSC